MFNGFVILRYLTIGYTLLYALPLLVLYIQKPWYLECTKVLNN